MSLSQMKYDEIMRGYEERREMARHAALENKQKVRNEIPEYRKIENEITDLAMECATRTLEGDTDAVRSLKAGIEELTGRQKALLRSHGFADDFLEEKYECPDCRDTGYTDGMKKCHCLVQRVMRCMYRQSNIEEVLKRENFDTLRYDLYTDEESERMRPIIDKCRKFADDFGKGYENILLLGNVGVGKTFLTNCMAKEIIDRGYSVIYFTSMRMFDTLSRGLFGVEEDRSWEVLDDLFTCDLLIIDDLGTESVNSFVSSRLFDVLNERDLRKKPTIISTNLSFKDMKDRYSERNFSRIFGNYSVLNPVAADMRVRMKRSEL